MKTIKSFLVVAMLLACGSVVAAPAPKPTPSAVKQSQLLIDPSDVHLTLAAPAPPNRIHADGLSYSGALIQVVKTQPRNFWQLVNPLAPAEYGSGTENLHIDIITGKPVGFKFFSISF